MQVSVFVNVSVHVNYTFRCFFVFINVCIGMHAHVCA